MFQRFIYILGLCSLLFISAYAYGDGENEQPTLKDVIAQTAKFREGIQESMAQGLSQVPDEALTGALDLQLRELGLDLQPFLNLLLVSPEVRETYRLIRERPVGEIIAALRARFGDRKIIIMLNTENTLLQMASRSMQVQAVLEEAEKKVATLEQEIKVLKARLERASSNTVVERLREDIKRIEARKDTEVASLLRKKLSKSLLETYANLLLAIDVAKKQKVDSSVIEGLEKVLLGIRNDIESQGMLLVLPQPGEAFDANLHEAMMHNSGTGPIVIQQCISPGTALPEETEEGVVPGKIIEPARVITTCKDQFTQIAEAG